MDAIHRFLHKTFSDGFSIILPYMLMLAVNESDFSVYSLLHK